MTKLVVAFRNFAIVPKSTFTNKNTLLLTTIIVVINVPHVADRQNRLIMRSLHIDNLMDRQNVTKQFNK
jgi:hypothetical protein